MYMYTNTALVVNLSHMPNHKPVIWLAVPGSWIVESAKPRNGSKGARLFPPLGGVVWARDCIIPDFHGGGATNDSFAQYCYSMPYWC